MANLASKNNFVYPSGTTASRPTSVNNGFIYFNTTVGALQIYQNGSWYVLTNINAPGAPTSVTATDQGTGRAYNNGQASISFTPATETYGFPATYTVTSTPGSYTATGTSSPLVITGLQSSTQYTYVVNAANNTGSTNSSASSGVTATTVPQAPTITATAGNTNATIAITPGATGGSAITQYTITSNPTTTTQTTSNTSYTFTGLTNGTAYTFTATATNANGTSSASSATSSITPAVAIVGAYEPIASITVPSGGVSSIVFSSIPQTYQHLQIRGIVKNTDTSANDYDNLRIRVNNDSGTNYTRHYLIGYGSGTPTSGGSGGNSFLYTGVVMRSGSAQTNAFGAFVIDLLDYTSSKNKVTKTLAGVDWNSSGSMWFQSSTWINTSAITSLEFTSDNANFAQYSNISLYGLKG